MTALFDRLRGWSWRGWAFALIVALVISLVIGLAALLAPMLILICFVLGFFLPLLRYASGIGALGSSIAFLVSVCHNNWSAAGVSLLILIVCVIVVRLTEFIGYKTGFAGPSDPYAWWYRKTGSTVTFRRPKL
jgi:hypothetical protein